MPQNNIISIFITDDDADDREFLTGVLAKKHFRCIFKLFGNGEELLNCLIVPSPLPDLIVLDLNMPVKDGYQTLIELKANAALKLIPVIVITSSSRNTDEERCYKLGCDNFMLKPLSLNGYEKLADEIISFVVK